MKFLLIVILFYLLPFQVRSESYLEVKNIKDYGAVSNDNIDDTRAFQKAIDDLEPYETLFIPEGLYLLTNTLIVNKKHIIIKGEGKNSILKFKYPKYSSVNSIIQSFKLEEAFDVEFNNFSIDGGATDFSNFRINDSGKKVWDVYGAYNIFLIHPRYNEAVKDIRILNMDLKNSYFSAIRTYGRFGDPTPKFYSSEIVVKSCVFSHIGFHGIEFNYVKDSKVIDNIIKDVGLAMMISGYGSGLGIDISAGCVNILVENNMIDGAGGGIKCETHHLKNDVVYSKDIKIMNNTIKNLYQGGNYSAFYGIKINGLNCSAIHNTIKSYEHGILIGIDAKNALVARNNILKTIAPDAAGIRCDKNGGGHKIIDNYIINTGGQGVLIANSHKVIISRNIIGFSRLDNIRIAGGHDILVKKNYLFNADNFDISVAPVGQMKISKLRVLNNVFFNLGREDKRVKKIFVANTVDNVKKENNLKLNNSGGLAFVKKAGIANLTVGEIILNDKFKKDGQKIVAWRVILSEGDKKLRAIGFNN